MEDVISMFTIDWFENQNGSIRTETRRMTWQIYFLIKSDQDTNIFRWKNDEHD